MDSFSNFNASDLGSNDLDFEQYRNLDFDFLSVETQGQSGESRKDIGTHDYHQHNAALMSSGNLSSHHNFVQSLTAVTPFTLSNDMLPTPESSEHNVCPDTMIMSPYTICMEDAFQDEERFYFEPLESPALGNQHCIPYYMNPGLLSPSISPTSSPVQIVNVPNSSPPRRSSQKSKSSFNHVNSAQRFSPINKQKVEKSNSISRNQRRKSSLDSNDDINGDNINLSSGNNIDNAQKLNATMTESPQMIPSSMNMTNLEQLISSPIVNVVITPSAAPPSTSAIQEPMPNLNLGSNLVSATRSTLLSLAVPNGPSASSFSEKIAPITPSSLMKLNKKTSTLKSSQSEKRSSRERRSPELQQDTPQKSIHNLKQSSEKNDQISEQQQSAGKEVGQSIFIAPSPPAKKPIKIATTVATGTQMVAIPSNVSPVSPRTMSPMILPSSPIARRSFTHNSSPSTLNPSKSPQALKPTISPNLKPKLPGVLADEVAEQLAKKSNYQSILEGTAKSLGISYPSDVHSSLESRRTTHKAAEQKRRDSLKQSFDELKKVVPFQSISSGNGNNGSGNSSSGSDGNNNCNSSGKNGDGNPSMKNVSKLFLLKRAHDYIVELHKQTREKDDIIQKLREELGELKQSKKRKVENDQQGEDRMELSKDDKTESDA
ncbi:323_t:CDS:2 [Acaulospora colombiana]|uniref:323_t:CDS:1 n=1 Tax=Acaulospora colombiana TaxID=27376 RepID=A0ACA9M2S8_9GLOM|nr:323_t:CDS:2 [Acaulospora colombiana]